MIYAVTVENYKGDQLEMRLSCPQFSGMNIYNISGLGTPKAKINTSETATRDGTIYNSARAQQRNIVFYIKYVDSLFEGSPGCMYPADEYGVCTDTYNDLVDKPSINDIALVGNMTAEELGLQPEMEPISTAWIEKEFAKGSGS